MRWCCVNALCCFPVCPDAGLLELLASRLLNPEAWHIGSEKLGLGNINGPTELYKIGPLFLGILCLEVNKILSRPAWSPPSIDSHLPPLGSDLPWPDTQKMHSNPPVIQDSPPIFRGKILKHWDFPGRKRWKWRLDQVPELGSRSIHGRSLGEMIPRIGPLGWCLCRRGWPSELSWFCQLYLSWHPTYKNFKSVVSVHVIFARLSRNVRI